jgi:hypothetical protein
MAYNASQDPRDDVRERMYLPELLKGLAITTRHFLRNLFGTRDENANNIVDRNGTSLVTTIQYPEEKIAYPPGYRGLHRLVPREDGKPRCVASRSIRPWATGVGHLPSAGRLHSVLCGRLRRDQAGSFRRSGRRV